LIYNKDDMGIDSSRASNATSCEESLEFRILQTIAEKEPINKAELAAAVGATSMEMSGPIWDMLDSGAIEVNWENRYVLLKRCLGTKNPISDQT